MADSTVQDEQQEPRALKLVSYDSANNKLKAWEEGLNALRRMPDDNLYVVTVIGPARSGKSTLLNWLLGRESAATFNTGDTPNPVTSGLDVWSHPVDARTDTGEVKKMVLIDCEGERGHAVSGSDVFQERGLV